MKELQFWHGISRSGKILRFIWGAVVAERDVVEEDTKVVILVDNIN